MAAKQRPRKRTKSVEGEAAQPTLPVKTKRTIVKTACSRVRLECNGEWIGYEELRAHLQKAIRTQHELALDAEGLSHVDANSLQLLLSATRAGGSIRLVNTSESVREYLRYAGSDRLLTTSTEAV